MIRLSTAAALLLFLCPSVCATDYYLDGSAGSDGNPGTAALPWRTITYALNQPLAAGDQLRLRGTFSTSETFPLSLLPGVSITTWDASTTARIDAGTSPCISIIRPGDHNGQILGESQRLTIAGSPAVLLEAPDPTVRCSTRISACRIEGGVDAFVARTIPAIGGFAFHVVIEDCEILGDLHFFSNSIGDWSASEMMSIALSRNTIRGDILAENPESRSHAGLLFEDNYLYGSIRCVETYGCDASVVQLQRNRIFAGDLICDSTPTNVSLMYPVVHDNVVNGGSILVTLNGDDDAASVLRNRVIGGDMVVGSYYLYPIEGNVVDGTLTVHAGTSFGRVSKNTCRALIASVFDYLTISDNTVGSGGILVPRAPYYFTIRDNTIASATDGIIVGAPGHGSRLAISEIEDNVIISSASSPNGTGVRVDCDLQRLYVTRNTVRGFDAGVVFLSTFAFDELHLTHNVVTSCNVALRADLGGGRSLARILSNTLSRSSTGLQLIRAGFTGLVELSGNIFSNNSITDVAPGNLLPTDDVRGNLAEDGSLLDFDPSNISGDPHFVDAANGDFHLRPTSPCIAPGNNPAGGDIGRYQSGLTPTLEVVELGANLVSLRTHGESGDHAILLLGAYPARPAAFSLCDGLLGLDVPTILTVVPGLISFGRWDLIVNVPPNQSFTAVLQSIRVDLNAPVECGLTNTRFFRR